MILLTHDSPIAPGDYIHYFDLHGIKKGSGVLVSLHIDPLFPLTRKKLILKNIYSNHLWSIKFSNYNIYYIKHITRQEKLMLSFLSALNNTTST